VRWPAVASVVVLAAVAIVVATGMRPEYDAYGWLVWGRETIHWSLNTNGAPSWKPLPYLFTVPFALFGRGQLWLWMVTSVASALAGALFAGRIAYRLTDVDGGSRYAPATAAAFAALGVLGISKYWHFILISNSDPMIVAVCLAAVDCHLSGRTRWAFGLLVLAALGRPEVWPFLALYAAWAWRADSSLRPLLVAGAAIIPALWFGIPALTANSALVSGTLAEGSGNALHGGKVTGVVDRLFDLYAWPMLAAVLLGLLLAALWRDRRTLLLGAAALLWVAIEVGFALHGWSAVPRYLFPAGAALIVVAAVAVGRLVAAGASARGAPRWAGPVVVVALVAALIPSVRDTARFVHGEISYGHKFARQVDRLERVIAAAGGSARILSCGQPVSALEFQSVLAWELGVNVGDVGWKPDNAIRSRQPVVLFEPRGWGWVVRPVHPRVRDRARCGGIAATTAFS
jgi:hypothetical protein